MRARSRVMLLAVAAIALAACVSVDRVSIESNVDPDYGQAIRRLYVVVDTQDTLIAVPSKVVEKQARGKGGEQEEIEVDRPQAAHLGDYLRTAIEERFSALGIETRAAVLSGLELDEGQINRDQAEFGAPTIMTVKQTEEKVEVHRGGYYSGSAYIPTTSTTTTYVFDVSITDNTTDRRVWRARLTAVGEFDPDSADSMIDDILVAMNADGLLELSAAQTQAIPEKRSTDSRGGVFLLLMLVPLALAIGLTLPLLLM